MTGIRCPAIQCCWQCGDYGLDLPEEATRSGTAKCVSKSSEGGRGARVLATKGKTSPPWWEVFLASTVRHFASSTEDVPVTGCVAAPTRLLGMQGAQNVSVSSPVTRISMFLAFALLV